MKRNSLRKKQFGVMKCGDTPRQNVFGFEGDG